MKIATLIFLVVNLSILWSFMEDLKWYGCIILGLCFVGTTVAIWRGLHPIGMNIALLFVMSCIYENIAHVDDEDPEDPPDDSNTPRPS